MGSVPTFSAADGTSLAYRVLGEGTPLICVPGGPMRASSYLGDLGGLSRYRQLIILDLRGTGSSAVPADKTSYRCERLAGDIVALLDYLGLDRADVLGHSAGANVVLQFAIRYPERIRRLAFITPSGRAIDLEPSAGMRREMVLLREGEPWFPAAAAAFERVAAGTADAGDWGAISPFQYGRWDAAAQALDAADDAERNDEAAEIFSSEGAFDPAGARKALASGDVHGPVLVLAGEVDIQRPPRILASFAEMFSAADFVVQPGAGHYPWMDDAEWFCSAVMSFLDA